MKIINNDEKQVRAIIRQNAWALYEVSLFDLMTGEELDAETTPVYETALDWAEKAIDAYPA